MTKYKNKTIAALLGSVLSFTVGFMLIRSYPATAFALGWCAGALIVYVLRNIKEHDLEHTKKEGNK